MFTGWLLDNLHSNLAMFPTTGGCNVRVIFLRSVKSGRTLLVDID